LIEDNAYTATIAYLKENEPTPFKEEYYRYRFRNPHHDYIHLGSEFRIDRNLYLKILPDSESTEQDFGNKGKVSSRSKSYTKNSLRRRFPLRQRKRVKCLKIAQIQGRYRAARLQGGRC
jgi:hypothetical protein